MTMPAAIHLFIVGRWNFLWYTGRRQSPFNHIKFTVIQGETQYLFLGILYL